MRGDEDQINKISVKKLGRILWRSEDRSHAFLVGAGVSKPEPADIKLASDLVDEFKQEIYDEKSRKPSPDEWASDYEVENKDEEQSEYGFWFSEAYPTKHARRSKVRDLVQESEPPLGQIILAKMLQDQIISHVFTPNFDDLLLEAAIDLPGVRPTFVDHEARASRFELSSESSAIFKLHGDYRHYTKNTAQETSELHDKMEEAFERSLREYGTVVIGYGGNDDSIMNVIESTKISEKGLFWCQLKNDDLPNRVREVLESRENAYLVEIEGSEPFFAILLNRMADDDFLQPEEIETKAQKKAERIRSLMEKADDVISQIPDESVSTGKETAISSNIDYLVDEDSYYDEEGRISDARESIKNGNLDYAEQLLNSVRDENTNLGSAQRELARIAERRGNYTDARDLLIECRVLAEREGNAKLRALAIDDLARLNEKQSRYEEAKELYNKSLSIRREIENRGGEASSLNGLGKIAFSRGDYDQAEEYHQESLEIQRDIGDRNGEANSLNQLGSVARKRGDYDQAKEYHQESLEIQRDIGDRSGEAGSINNLGNVVLSQGDYEQAREYYEESLEITRDIGTRDGEATVLGNLGLIASDQGEFEQAREYHEKSLEIARNLGNRASEANGLLNLGNVSLEQDNYQKAREYYQESLEITRDIGSRDVENKSLKNLALAASNQDDYDEAHRYHEESLKITRDIGNRADEVNSLLNLGDVAREAGDLEDAKEQYKQAKDIVLDLDEPRLALNVLSKLSDVAAESDDTETALQSCETALSLIEDIEIPRLYEYEREFRARLARLGDAPLSELYARGLDSVLVGNKNTAMELLKDSWNCLDEVEPSDDEYPFVLGAGVGFAAHLELSDSDEAESNLNTILSTIEPHADDLSPAAHGLFDYLTSSDVSLTPDNIRNDAANIDKDEPLTNQIDTLESEAYADLLEYLN